MIESEVKSEIESEVKSEIESEVKLAIESATAKADVMAVPRTDIGDDVINLLSINSEIATHSSDAFCRP